MIKILNKNRQYVAYLENAFNIGYEKTFNQIWGASFSLPLNDPKNEECKALYYVEVYDNDEYIGLFRIVPKRTIKNESTEIVTYQCEHVLATLLDSSLFQYHQTDNITTRENLQYILDQQKVKHWVLGTVSFTRYFSYKWENENLLSALFSVPKPFDVQYRWTWNTQVYPWVLNLVPPETAVTCEIRERKNLIGLELEENPMGVFNRIYPLGYGEGINQLNIAAVNNGVPYVDDAESIAEYGIHEYIWVDKRFEDALTLKASAEGLLKEWKEPIANWRISAADLSSRTGESIDKLKEGRIVRLNVEGFPVTDLRIMKESKPDTKGEPWNVQLEIGNLNADLGTTQADLQRRQQINELYAQGATNILFIPYNDNADPDHPVEMKFYLPEEFVKLNKLLLSFVMDKFRAYERAIGGGGSIVKSTSSGGGSQQTSSSGGGVATSTESGGGSTQTSSSGGGTSSTTSEKTFVQLNVMTGVPENAIGSDNYGNHLHEVQIPGSVFDHSHTFTIGSHTHTVTIPTHSHNFTIPNHSHTVTIPAHTHDITLPDHTHAIQFGIFKLDNVPSKVTIKVDGNTVPYTVTNGDNIDLIPYLSKDSEGRVNRGWHTVTITPNDLGRINAQIYTQFFIQSRGGGNF
ncbi:phage tail protein [Cytobacillus oceanisediminis]|uniref:phage tail protein n=1 Tax=Cytobacillus oceanisediminis TaxID=665099 RepID=UPI00203E9856|nr:phage tail protein [Cytobacillus oceanisediminis]MCM3241336.1 phage tail protein [Cytobacillus oceanisediminis]